MKQTFNTILVLELFPDTFDKNHKYNKYIVRVSTYLPNYQNNKQGRNFYFIPFSVSML